MTNRSGLAYRAGMTFDPDGPGLGGPIPGNRIGPDGWLSLELAKDLTIHLRVEPADEYRVTPVVTHVLIAAPDIDTEVLRNVHPHRLLAQMNQGTVVAAIRFLQDDSSLTLGELRDRVRPPKRRKRKPLGRPDAARDRDGFYQAVAIQYRSAATESGRPAMVLAEENEVPVETVRRWVKEARRRGHLSAGRKGRAI